MKADNARSLVVLSGGQDSTTCLYWAIDRYGAASVDTLTFDYGQRHRIELECAQRVVRVAGNGNPHWHQLVDRGIAGITATRKVIEQHLAFDRACQLFLQRFHTNTILALQSGYCAPHGIFNASTGGAQVKDNS